MGPGTITDQIWRMSPEYQLAFEEGYNAAKQEMMQLIRRLEALKTSTATIDL